MRQHENFEVVRQHNDCETVQASGIDRMSEGCDLCRFTNSAGKNSQGREVFCEVSPDCVTTDQKK